MSFPTETTGKSNRLWVIVLIIFLCADIFLFYHYWQVKKGNTTGSDGSEISTSNISSVPTVFEKAPEDRLSSENNKMESYGPGYREMGDYGAFAGDVIEKGTDFLIVSGGGEKVKVNIVPETFFWLPLLDEENPGKILPQEKMPAFSGEDIKVGDFVDISFSKKINEKEYEAGMVLISKKTD